ncbi:MAG: hypothetical protein ACTS9Y_01130 [Methylophilus sp.]|uniref:hypothetical protein n=1 Tax=Methylophilus sp. TaxID=29541 RepID=UPI003F9F8171
MQRNYIRNLQTTRALRKSHFKPKAHNNLFTKPDKETKRLAIWNLSALISSLLIDKIQPLNSLSYWMFMLVILFTAFTLTHYFIDFTVYVNEYADKDRLYLVRATPKLIITFATFIILLIRTLQNESDNPSVSSLINFHFDPIINPGLITFIFVSALFLNVWILIAQKALTTFDKISNKLKFSVYTLLALSVIIFFTFCNNPSKFLSPLPQINNFVIRFNAQSINNPITNSINQSKFTWYKSKNDNYLLIVNNTNVSAVVIDNHAIQKLNAFIDHLLNNQDAQNQFKQEVTNNISFQNCTSSSVTNQHTTLTESISCIMLNELFSNLKTSETRSISYRELTNLNLPISLTGYFKQIN